MGHTRERLELPVEGMSCASCAGRIERRLNGLEAEFILQEKPLDQLRNLKQFALPLIGMLDSSCSESMRYCGVCVTML